jgi:N-acetylmuramoyl-L-alanine amidase
MQLSRAIAYALAIAAFWLAHASTPAFAAAGHGPVASVQPIAAQHEIPIVIGIQLQDRANQSRITLEFSDPVAARSFLLTDPNRIVIELPEVVWRPAETPPPPARGFIRNYRFGMFRKDSARLVLELNRPARIDKTEILPPADGAGFRLVIDLSPATQPEFSTHAGWPRGSEFALRQSSTGKLSVKEQREQSVIILDPGHGGMDPGTHGETGLVEKDLALSVARRLKEKLEQTGRYRVKLTRDSDVFIPLRDRVAIARAAHGDLFVSLHADSNEHREIRGASVYTLSPGASDREAASLAEKENHAGVALGLEPADANSLADSILSDLGQREIMNLSARFAEGLVAALPRATALHTPLPHRSADFAVLKAPDIPSVLIELGYLTNHDDEMEMTTEAWRSRVAATIAAMIDHYFSEAPALQATSDHGASRPLSGHIRGVRTPAGTSSTAQELTQ